MTTKMEHKNILAELLASEDDTGSFEAVIATTGVVDSDSDVIAPGAMEGNTVPILPAHDSGSVPLGKAKIEERDDQVVAIGKFNLDIQAAREWFSAIKADLQDPPAKFEYSWGFIPTKFRFEEQDDMQVRVIEELDLLEVSPVLRGASVGTRTLSAKERREKDDAKADADPEKDAKGADDEPRVKLADEVKAALDTAASAVQRVSEVSEARAKRGKHLDSEVLKELVLLGSEIASLVELSHNITDMKPAEESEDLNKKARALAAYMAHRARWGR